jgi:peptide/nickel transport system permease protein
MAGYILRRVLGAFPIMFLVAFFVFGLIYIAPGDPAAVIAGDAASPQDIARIRAELGLDRPFLKRFAVWLWGVVQGDLGTSIYSNLPVSGLIASRLGPTLMLAAMTMVVAVLLAVPFGILAAWQARTAIDRGVMGFAVLGFSIPVFVLGYGLIIVFAVHLGWFPVQGYEPLADGLGASLASLALPSVSLGVILMALLSRMTRTAMIEVLNEDYIRTARAKGASTGAVLLRHALKNAAAPIVTTIGLGVALLIGGVVVTETVFALPGIGRLTVDAILNRDFPVIQGVILFFAGTYVLVNLLVDLAYAAVDPRIRY